MLAKNTWTWPCFLAHPEPPVYKWQMPGSCPVRQLQPVTVDFCTLKVMLTVHFCTLTVHFCTWTVHFCTLKIYCRTLTAHFGTSTVWFFTFVTVCLRSKKQNKQHYNCLALFSTVARFELEPQIRETLSYQTSSSGNMPRRNLHCKYYVPRRNLHCKYYVLKHITIQALEATQSHNAPSLTMLTLYHCKLQLRPFHFEVW